MTLDAAFWRSFHRVAAIAWIMPGVLAAWWIVYQVPEPHAAFAILVVSLYANAATHWSAWQAARAEEKVDATINADVDIEVKP